MIRDNSVESVLPFAHGVEIELQVIRRNGTWIRGEEIVQIFEKIVSSAKSALEKKIRASSVKSVLQKYRQSSQTEEGERGSRVVTMYEDPHGEVREYTLIGHDPNVTSLTWILEVATPPCTTIEELAWWIQTLIAISHESLPKESQIIMISTGLNPTQEYLKNLSFGEHHHILDSTVDETTRLAVYNMIRNFIPHLIALTVNSPFEDKMPTGVVSTDLEGRLMAPRCKKSIRLMKNTTQMGPINEFEFVPHLAKVDKEGFAKHVNRSYARMVDIYPFTDYGTIEIRVFDTQLSIPRRVGLALLLQALALKARKVTDKGLSVPDAHASSLAHNRNMALSAGLWAPFRPGFEKSECELSRIYNNMISEQGELTDKPNRYMSDAVVSMLFFIRDELEELNLVENPFLQPLLVSVFGSEIVSSRTTGADFQLQVYAESDQNMVVLLRRLSEITRECCTNWLYDPLGGIPKLPAWLCLWKGLEPEIIVERDKIFAGQEAQFVISLRNSSGREINDITVNYSVEDSDRNAVTKNIIVLARLNAGEIHLERLAFKTSSDITAYNIMANVVVAGKEIPLTSTLNTYWMSIGIRSETTTQFADDNAPVLFTGEIENNYPAQTSIRCEISVLAPKREKVLASTERRLVVEPDEVFVFNNNDFPELLIPSNGSSDVERCYLVATLFGEKEHEISSTTSRPFYVGFRAREAVIRLRVSPEVGITLGQDANIEIEAKLPSTEAYDSAYVALIYHADSNKQVPIAEFATADIIDGITSIAWTIPSELVELSDRSGRVQATLFDDEKEQIASESVRILIQDVEIQMSIDSLRIVGDLRPGGTVNGWLRIRRNNESGTPAILKLSLQYGIDDTYLLLEQAVKQSRDLSLAFGPLRLPVYSDNQNLDQAEFIAELFHGGKLLDKTTQTVKLKDIQTSEELLISIAGLPRFMMPDQLTASSIKIENDSTERLEGTLTATMDSVIGEEDIFSRDIALKPGESRMFGAHFRAPLAAEMSTGYLRARFVDSIHSVECKEQFKVKAIEEPLFKVDLSIIDEREKEIPGLVPRSSRVRFIADIEAHRENITDLNLLLRIMSRRESIEELEQPLVFVENKSKASYDWITPELEMVTNYYIDAAILHKGRLLPSRAVNVRPKQFTVY